MLRHSTLCLALAALLGAALPGLAAPKPPAKPSAPAGNPYAMPKADPLPGIEKVPHPVPAVFVETSAEKPRLGIIFTGQPPEFRNRLAAALEKSRRFAVASVAPQSLATLRQKLVPGLTLKDAQGFRASAKLEMALVCDAKVDKGELTAHARLADLRTGDVSRDLAIFGQNNNVQTLASTLASYVRQAAPLRCLVRNAGEDEILLDLGENDGVKKDSTFQIVRYPQNLVPLPVATIKVTSTDAFRARAEVEDSRPGLTVSSGDVAIEDTGDLKI